MIRIVFLILLLFVLVVPSLAQEKRYSVPIGKSPSYGTENSPITIIEFLDYQ